ncbi:MAG: FkbM family methyltransferase [Roseicyclus sp.]|nr:FkbM family methyltransferase [Roseicyclus sp.]
MNVILSENVTAMLARPHHVRTPDGVMIVRAIVEGQVVHFATRDLDDRIQRRHARGKFYEPEELEIIARHFPKGGVFCDIGANIGNHSLYALNFLGAAKSIVFEPNPAAYELLVLNMIFNGCFEKVDFSHLGMGLSDIEADNMGLNLRGGSLGATQLEADSGDIQVAPADNLLDGTHVDFIKIDVKGMELAVLGGLTKTLAAHRPPIFVEVEHSNRPGLDAWMATSGYGIAEEGRQLRHNGNLLLTAGDAPGAMDYARPDVDHSGPDLRSMVADAVASRAEQVGVGQYQGVEITRAEINGQAVVFATDMVRDPIQRSHRGGVFFEPEELGLIRSHLPKGGTFVDIGANVGNHSLFAGLFTDAARIIPFEPNPLAYRLLVLNVVLNRLEDRVVFDHLGFGASDLAGDGFAMTKREKNLGAARMVAGAGEISTVRPDDVLRDEEPDVIKIDVEGMEMQVLRGLQKTVARTRPVLLVEVDRENTDDFTDWRLAHGFEILKSIKHYVKNCNFLCVPEEGVTPQARQRLAPGAPPSGAKTRARRGKEGKK